MIFQQAMAGLADRYDVVVPALFSRLGDRSLFTALFKLMNYIAITKTL
ncbi:MAG: hypothetical protein O4859_31760 [Trichodesmium sp. St18_bin1]|nr:hypothetical protein [Trichodesmium sp. St18_bin1]